MMRAKVLDHQKTEGDERAEAKKKIEAKIDEADYKDKTPGHERTEEIYGS